MSDYSYISIEDAKKASVTKKQKETNVTNDTPQLPATLDDWSDALPEKRQLAVAEPPPAETSSYFFVYTANKIKADRAAAIKECGINPANGSIIFHDKKKDTYVDISGTRIMLLGNSRYFGYHDFDEHGELKRASLEKQDGLAETVITLGLVLLKGDALPVPFVTRVMKSQQRFVADFEVSQAKSGYNEFFSRLERTAGAPVAEFAKKLPQEYRVAGVLNSKPGKTSPDKNGKVWDYIVVRGRCSGLSAEEFARLKMWKADAPSQADYADCVADFTKRVEAVEKMINGG